MDWPGEIFVGNKTIRQQGNKWSSDCWWWGEILEITSPPLPPPSLFYSIPPSPLPHLFISAYTLSQRKTTFRDIHNMKCSWKNMILRGIFHAVSYFLYISCYIAEIWIAFLTVYSHLTIHIQYNHVERMEKKDERNKQHSKQHFECLQIII